jgi:hypothetical protein
VPFYLYKNQASFFIFSSSLIKIQYYYYAHIVDYEALRDILDLAKEDGRKREAGEEAQQPYLIWIDILCCPIRPAAAKNMSLEKITDAYRGACHVFVLDSSLERIKSEELSEVEILGRIPTSSWMRRLWTLQGKIMFFLLKQETDFCFFPSSFLEALAKSLCFQFADRAVSLPETRLRLYHITNRDSRYWGVYQNFTLEWIRLDCFFRTDPGVEQKYLLMYLNRALQYRSVSVMLDEPL